MLNADAKHAQALGRERRLLESVVDTLRKVGHELSDTRELFEMAQAKNDEDTLQENPSGTAQE